MLYSIIGMLVVIVDQLVKFWVDRNINWTNPTRTFIPGFMSLVRVQNDGAAFSFLSGSGARVWFIVITGVFALLVVLALATNFVSGKFGRWCLVLVTAGGISNMIDRIRYGFVLDMFKLEIFDFAVFNVADIFITVFCIAFILYILFGGEKKREVDEDEFDEEDYEEDVRPARVSSARKPARRASRYDDEEDEEPVRRKSSKKAAEIDYDDDDDDDEDMPLRRAQRSGAAAAAAYRRRPDESVGRTETAAVSGKRRPADSGHVQEKNVGTQRVAAVRRSVEKDVEDMFETEAPVRKPSSSAQAKQKTSAASARKAETGRKAPAARTVPQTDPDNPFAEWEQANAKVSAAAGFKSYSDPEPQKAAKPAQPVRPSSVSSDFDLDDILNEFK